MPGLASRRSCAPRGLRRLGRPAVGRDGERRAPSSGFCGTPDAHERWPRRLATDLAAPAPGDTTGDGRGRGARADGLRWPERARLPAARLPGGDGSPLARRRPVRRIRVGRTLLEQGDAVPLCLGRAVRRRHFARMVGHLEAADNARPTGPPDHRGRRAGPWTGARARGGAGPSRRPLHLLRRRYGGGLERAAALHPGLHLAAVGRRARASARQLQSLVRARAGYR